MKLASVALAFVLTVAALPAHADWNNTKWGMSVAEVSAIYPGLIQEDAGADVARYHTKSAFNFVGIDADTTTFAFDRQGLASVQIRAKMTPFYTVKAKLIGQFGAPVEQRTSSVSEHYTFIDREKGNKISLMGVGPLNEMFITYEKISQEF